MFNLDKHEMMHIKVVPGVPVKKTRAPGILELANYRVYNAENGKVGVEAALKERPDLIVCDITMPVLVVMACSI